MARGRGQGEPGEVGMRPPTLTATKDFHTWWKTASLADRLAYEFPEDMSGMDFFHFDFSGLDLRSRKFDGADLRGAQFTGTLLEGASFKDARVGGADFRDAFVSQEQFTHEQYEDGRFDFPWVEDEVEEPSVKADRFEKLREKLLGEQKHYQDFLSELNKSQWEFEKDLEEDFREYEKETYEMERKLREAEMQEFVNDAIADLNDTEDYYK